MLPCVPDPSCWLRAYHHHLQELTLDAQLDKLLELRDLLDDTIEHVALLPPGAPGRPLHSGQANEEDATEHIQ